MKKLFQKIGIVAMTLSVFTLSSCGELEDLLKFDFDIEGEALYFDVEATIPAGEIEELGVKTFDESLSDIIKKHAPDANINKIKEINVTSIKLEIANGSDADNHFGNIEDIYVEVKATGANVRTVAEVFGNPNTNTTTLVIPIEGQVNLKQYFEKTNFEYTIKGKLRNPITKDLRIKMTADYSFVFGL